jgi:glutathione S-transferase
MSPVGCADRAEGRQRTRGSTPGRDPPCATLRAMNKPKLTYFDAPVSRGEECRLALHLAGVDFEDVRINSAAWPAMKEQTPYGGVPVLELPGHPPLAHSNAILVLIGRRHGLHPADDFEAAQHEGMMQHVEDLRCVVSPTIRMGEAEKKTAREAIVAGYLPAWARSAEKNIKGTPFFGGAKLNVVDLKIHMAVRWFIGGKVDHIPATIFSGCPKLTGVHDAVRDHAGVKSWYEKR